VHDVVCRPQHRSLDPPAAVEGLGLELDVLTTERLHERRTGPLPGELDVGERRGQGQHRDGAEDGRPVLSGTGRVLVLERGGRSATERSPNEVLEALRGHGTERITTPAATEVAGVLLIGPADARGEGRQPGALLPARGGTEEVDTHDRETADTDDADDADRADGQHDRKEPGVGESGRAHGQPREVSAAPSACRVIRPRAGCRNPDRSRSWVPGGRPGPRSRSTPRART